MGLTTGRIVSAAAPPFDPDILFANGAQGMRYDPSDFSSMFQDVPGTIAVTATTQEVRRINDKSGNGHHATAATLGAGPTLQQDAGGKYYLLSNGTGYLTNATLPYSAARFLMLAGKSEAAAGSTNRIIGSTDNESIYDNGTQWSYFSPGQNLGAAPRPNPTVFGYYKPDNTVANGINGLTDGAGFVPTTHTEVGLGLFSSSRLGSDPLAARIYGAVIVNGVPTKASRDDMARYQAGKAGIVL